MDKSAKQAMVKGGEEEGFVEVNGEVNGEQVEQRARQQQFIEFVRTGVSGLGKHSVIIVVLTGAQGLMDDRLRDGCGWDLGRWRISC